MGNESNCCSNNKDLSEHQDRIFLDVSQPNYANKTQLINLIRDQYDHQLLPNVKELHKVDRKKLQKLIQSSTTPQRTNKQSSNKNSPIIEVNNTAQLQKIKASLHEFTELQRLKQECKKVQTLENKLTKRPNLNQQEKKLIAQKAIKEEFQKQDKSLDKLVVQEVKK